MGWGGVGEEKNGKELRQEEWRVYLNSTKKEETLVIIIKRVIYNALLTAAAEPQPTAFLKTTRPLQPPNPYLYWA